LAEERWVTVGRVGRPHGLDGSFVVEHASEAPERFAPGARVYLGREPVEVVERKRGGGGRLVVRLDRRVERGTLLELPVSELPEPEPDSYYAFQLVGLDVLDDDGNGLGAVAAVHPGAANDNLELADGTLVPLIEDAIREIDLDRRRVVVASGFLGR
jgi:16S rRNA processing protein RimM